NGSVDIGGSITADDYRQNWSWAVGSGFDKYEHSTSQLTEQSTKLTISVDKNMPILLGKTLDVYPKNIQNGQGASPQITYTGFDGAKLEMVSAGTDGLVTMDVPVKDKNGQDETGKLTINGMLVNATAYLFGNEIYMGSLIGKKPGEIFYGGTPVNNDKGVPNSDTNIFAELPTKDDFVSMITAKYPGTSFGANNSGGLSGDASGKLNGGVGAYGFGLKSGQTLVVKFDKAVTGATEWVAPINVQVSYY
ncbi:TPA: hypothetical protein OCY54_005171, partial [Escherichia coli]|nr:hypothetical protein [Escherichia coli]